MEDVMLRIKGCTITSDGEKENREEILEFVTEGTMQQRGGIMRISYPDSEISGFAGCTTSLVVTPQKVSMKRSLPDEMTTPAEMEFEKGRRFYGVYQTPYGSMGMEILTNDIRRKLSGGTGCPQALSIDYSVSLSGQAEWRQCLDIEILKKN